MARLPVITGFGGVNAAGRSSFHHAYRRLIIDALDSAKTEQTYNSLAALMALDTAGVGLSETQKQFILDHTLVRRIEGALFDVDAIETNKRMPMTVADGKTASFTTKARSLPEHIPSNWKVTALDDKMVRIDIEGDAEFLFPTSREATVKTAGQLPSGFDPGSLYPSRSHPRGLQMAIYGASDAVQSVGIDWELIRQKVAPDQISVYASSGMGQLDASGYGGMLGPRYNDKRTTSKHCPFGMPQMPADFINAYVLGSVGNTGAFIGACATNLYNIKQAVNDIKSGAARVVVVGTSEAPVVSDVMDGYAAMGALATDHALLALDEKLGLTAPNHRRSVRPFSSNCGFTIAESAQFIVLMDDALAIEMGATIYGAISDVFISADGFKKSISSPGVGNYLTVAKALASARSLLGEESIKHRSFVQAHGTSTPQNRVSESHILNEMAKTFGIEKWPVAAVKAYFGHSIGSSAGDQLMASLGVWAEGIIPGINTIDHVADDVYNSNLDISAGHKEVGLTGMDSTILNTKGFGGNNASAAVIAPHIVAKMLANKYGKEAYAAYRHRNESVQENATAYDKAAMKGEALPVYKFDHNVVGAAELDFSNDQLAIPGYGETINLKPVSPYKDLL